MTYLFWSFAVVWIALFAYVHALMRRTRALEEEVRRLEGEVPDATRTTPPLEDRPAPPGGLRPVGRALRP